MPRGVPAFATFLAALSPSDWRRFHRPIGGAFNVLPEKLGELGVADRSWLLMARAGPWERSKHAMCRMWHEWDDMQEVVAEQRTGTV